MKEQRKQSSAIVKEKEQNFPRIGRYKYNKSTLSFLYSVGGRGYDTKSYHQKILEPKD